MSQSKKQKIAILFHPIRYWGGAQLHLRKTLDALTSESSEVTVYCSYYFKEQIEKRFSQYNIKATFLQYFPFKKQLQHELVSLEGVAFKLLNLKGYDTVIAISDGFEKIAPLPKPARKILITLTPPRFLYLNTRSKVDFKRWTYLLYRAILEKPLHALWRMWDINGARQYDEVYSISSAVASRVKEHWDMDSEILYPPVPLDEIKYNPDYKSRKDHFVFFGGIEEYKGVELAIRGCILANVKLHVHGNGQYLEPMKKLVAEKNAEHLITFYGRYADEDKLVFLNDARGGILPARDEDFGITFVEVLASGMPLIAYKDGGAVDIIGDYKNIGILIDQYTPEAVAQAIKSLDKISFNPELAKERASYFSTENFKLRLRKIVYGTAS